MNEVSHPRRVLVAVDFTGHRPLALESAAGLAARLRAELVALFVEDIDLMRLAELPFAREVDRTSGETRALDHSQVSRALRARAEVARRALDRVTQTFSVRASMQVVRGRYMTEALSAAAETDVLFLARTRRPAFGVSHAGEPGLKGGGRGGSVRPEPVWVLYDGSPEADRALRLAGTLAEGQAPLAVMLLTSPERDARTLETQATEIIGDRALAARFVVASAPEPGAVRQAVAEEGGSLLVLYRGGFLLRDATAHAALESLSCLVVVAA